MLCISYNDLVFRHRKHQNSEAMHTYTIGTAVITEQYLGNEDEIQTSLLIT